LKINNEKKIEKSMDIPFIERCDDEPKTDTTEEEEEEEEGFVYTITNTKNNKVYYGSTKNVKKRWTIHKSNLKSGTHHNMYLQNSWNKYGADAFEFKIIAQFFILTEARKMEEELLEVHFQTPLCFNLSKAALGGDNTSKHPNNAAIREKLSIAGKRRFAEISGEERKKSSQPGEQNGMFGRHHTEEAKKKIREGKVKYYQEHEANFKGQHHTEETRVKMSISAKQRTGAKNSFFGRSHSEETRQILSAQRLGRPNLACAFKVRVDGVEYESAAACAKKLNQNLGTILNRCRNPKFGTYELVDKD
jgi:group I intron endonuclease